LTVNNAVSEKPSIITFLEDKEQIDQRIWDSRRVNSDENPSEISIGDEKKRCKKAQVK